MADTGQETTRARIVTTSAGAADEGKVPVLDSSGQLDSTFDNIEFESTLFENITGGEPVKLVNDSGTLKLATIKGYSPFTTSVATKGNYVQNNHHFCWKLSETQFVVIWEWRNGGAGNFYPYMQIVDISSGTPVGGGLVNLGNSGSSVINNTHYPIKLLRITDTTFVYGYRTNSNAGVVKLYSVSGTTITEDDSSDWDGGATNIMKDIALVDTGMLVATFYDGSNTVIRAGSFTGTTWGTFSATPITHGAGDLAAYVRKISTNRMIVWTSASTESRVLTLAGTVFTSVSTPTLTYSITDMHYIEDGILGFIYGASSGILTESAGSYAYSGLTTLASSSTATFLRETENTNEFIITTADGVAQLIFDTNNDKVGLGARISGQAYDVAYGKDMGVGYFYTNQTGNRVEFTIGAHYDFDKYVGFLETTKTAGQTGNVLFTGKIVAGTNLVQGNYYIGDTGVLTPAPLMTTNSIEIGRAISATEILLN